MIKKLKEQDFISVILYANNNANVISETLSKIWDLFNNKFENFEIIIMNDASEDDTKNKIREFLKKKDSKKITLINLSSKHGLEVAMQAGMDYTIGDFVIEVDSSQLNYDVNMLYELYKTSCKGYDIVSLQPKTKKRISSKLFYFILNKSLDIKINFNTQIAHIITRRAINAISKIKNNTIYRKLLHSFSGYRQDVIEVDLTKKIKSSYNFSARVKMAFDILFSFTNIGMRINIYLSLLFFLFSVFMGIYAIYQYITYQEIIEGWATLMLFLSFGFSGLFMTLSITNKYFLIMLREVRILPKYNIDNIEKR